MFWHFLDVVWIGVFTFVYLLGVIAMSAHENTSSAWHGTRQDYAIGFLLSVVLTAMPFWLVMTGVFASTATAIAVTVLAVAQILVHTVFFLHVNTRAEGGWTLLA